MTEPAKRIYFGGKSPQALPWKPLPFMQDYLDNLALDGQASEYVRPVKVGLTHFAIFADLEGIRHPEELTRMHILRFQGYLQNVHRPNGDVLSLAYRQQLMKYVRGWVRWLVEIEHVETNPWVRIKIGRVAKKPKPLEVDEVLQLFTTHKSQAFSIPPFHFHRRETILALLYGWGLRIGELQALNLANMDVRLEWVTVYNKGGGSKQMPYGKELKDAVQRWLKLRASHAEFGEDALLIDQYGKRLSIPMIRKIITELGGRAGITINPHRLRDTFGTTLMDNDVPIERIMALMGHTQRSQTLGYARLNNPKLRESHDKVITPLLGRLLNSAPSPPTGQQPSPFGGESE